jgi:hypothetical protein
MNQVVDYNIDRKGASKLLKVSVRTVDRYLKSKKLSSRLVDGRIWLNKDEVEGYLDREHRGLKVDSEPVSTYQLSSDNTIDKDDNTDDNVDKTDAFSAKTTTRKKTGNTYKKLYEKLQEDLQEKQGRLEIANYRVGQLENQLRNSIPLLQYHRETSDRLLLEKKHRSEIKEKTHSLQTLQRALRNEKAIKKVFAFFCFLIMALQPLWLLLLPN